VYAQLLVNNTKIPQHIPDSR